MERKARSIVFWPCMTNDIRAVCDSCVHCNRNAPPQAPTPPISSNPPATPFEKIFADYFMGHVIFWSLEIDFLIGYRYMYFARHLERMSLRQLL